MNNIIFCLDKNYINILEYDFKTFSLFHNLKKYKFYFVLYDENKNIHIEIINILTKISKNINIVYKYFIPTDELKSLVNNFMKIIFGENLPITVYNNYANWSRFYINELFPNLNTGLYLDMDILFNGNIDEIFNTDISNNIVGVIPYDTKILFYFKKHLSLKKNLLQFNYLDFTEKTLLNNNILIQNYIEKNNIFLKLMKNFNFKIDDLNNYSYNCGVLYFNFKLFKSQEILKKIILLLKFINDNKCDFFKTGTEKTFNFIVNKYKILPSKYNFIYNKNLSNNIFNNIIIHFKGQKILPNNIYKKEYFKIMSKNITE